MSLTIDFNYTPADHYAKLAYINAEGSYNLQLERGRQLERFSVNQSCTTLDLQLPRIPF